MNDLVSTAEGVIERAFDLPLGYCATFIWRGSDKSIEVHWLPDLPHIRKPRLQRKLLAAYETARRDFFEDVAAVVGRKISILGTG